MKRKKWKTPLAALLFGGGILGVLFLLGSCNCGPQNDVDVLGKACSLDVQCFGLKCINGICQSGEGSYFEGAFSDGKGEKVGDEKLKEEVQGEDGGVGDEAGPDEGVKEAVKEAIPEEPVKEAVKEEVPEKECTPGEIRYCYTGKSGCVEDKDGNYNCISPCRNGIQYCEGGFWTKCLNELIPKKEICDGKDNDCDGQVDEEISGCVITVAGPPPKENRYQITVQYYFSRKDNSVYFAHPIEARIYKFDYYQNIFIDVFINPGKGFVDGPFGKAKFGTMGAIALDEKRDYLYVVDTTNLYIRKLDLKNKTVNTIAGNGKKATRDGPAQKASISIVNAMIVSPDGTKLYFTEKNCIRMLDLGGNYLKTVTGDCERRGYRDGSFADALFNSPFGMDFDAQGNLIVADSAGSRIRKLDLNANQVTTIAGSGQKGDLDGPALQAKLFSPIHAMYDRQNTLYIADALLRKIKKLENGKITTVAGTGEIGFRDGPSSTAIFIEPKGVFPISPREVLVVDLSNNRLRKIDTVLKFVSTVAGGGPPGFKNGKASEAQFFLPSGMTFAPPNIIYIADQFNHCIRILDLKNRKVSTFTGRCQYAGERNGKVFEALYRTPIDVAYDSKNKILYIAQKYSIKKVDLVDNTVSVLAGAPGKIGCKDGSFTEARFNSISEIELGSDGSLYLTDAGNHLIRKLDFTDKKVKTIAGQCLKSGSSDGKGSSARFNGPGGLYVDSNGDIYVADSRNHCIRKIDKNGNVTTEVGECGVAGTRNGIAKDARLFFPTDLVKSSKGNFYITEFSSSCIRKWDKNGTVSQFIGKCGVSEKLRDGTLKDARISGTVRIISDGKNTLYFIEAKNRIRKVTLP